MLNRWFIWMVLKTLGQCEYERQRTCKTRWLNRFENFLDDHNFKLIYEKVINSTALAFSSIRAKYTNISIHSSSVWWYEFMVECYSYCVAYCESDGGDWPYKRVVKCPLKLLILTLGSRKLSWLAICCSCTTKRGFFEKEKYVLLIECL